jgi:hypothetical protein
MSYERFNAQERHRFLMDANRKAAEVNRGLYENNDGTFTIYEKGENGGTGVFTAKQVAQDLGLSLDYRVGVNNGKV